MKKTNTEAAILQKKRKAIAMKKAVALGFWPEPGKKCGDCGRLYGDRQISDYNENECDGGCHVNVLRRDGVGVVGYQCRACGATWASHPSESGK